MKSLRFFIQYIIAISAIIGSIWFSYYKLAPAKIPVPSEHSEVLPGSGHAKVIHQFYNSSAEDYFHNPNKPFIMVLMQLAIIILAARAAGWLASKIGQQKVIGEIIAGIVLGPSLFGNLAPELQKFIFPDYSMTSLYVLSQLGLILFMFIVGMETNTVSIRAESKKAVFISHTTIGFSILLGFLVASFLYENHAPKDVNFVSFGLFVGVSLSITAFPVLARILQERKMAGTPVGNLLTTIAAIDDVTAWCLLAMLFGFTGATSMSGALITACALILFILFMFLVLRPMLEKFASKYFKSTTDSNLAISTSYMVLICSAFASRYIGVHALFGAFLAGVCMPRSIEFRDKISSGLKHVSSIILLPVFFTLSGLRTHIELLNSSGLWLVFMLILATACTGKIAGGFLFSRIAGLNRQDSLNVGILLNTRGLMELIVLNIGLDLGVITVEFYTIMVLMAIATTLLTSPLLYWHSNYVLKQPIQSPPLHS